MCNVLAPISGTVDPRSPHRLRSNNMENLCRSFRDDIFNSMAVTSRRYCQSGRVSGKTDDGSHNLGGEEYPHDASCDV